MTVPTDPTTHPLVEHIANVATAHHRVHRHHHETAHHAHDTVHARRQETDAALAAAEGTERTEGTDDG